MLRAVSRKCDELHVRVDPTTVVVDFEQAAINAVRTVLGQHVVIQGYFYHLTQSTWRHIQEMRLVPLYNKNKNVKQFCRMLDALTFLPAVKVRDEMTYLRGNIPECEGKEQLEQLLNYFYRTYVSGTFRSTQRPKADGSMHVVHLRRIPPNVCNVHDATISGTARSNNFSEGWNSSFRQLVG